MYLTGAAALLLRLLGQLLSLALLHWRARPVVVLGQAVRVVPGAGEPFSFSRTIYLTEAALADAGALGAILRHEQAHVRHAHTFDVLLQMATPWPNPAAWLLRRLALDNLEYLADRAALHRSGLAPRDYQYLLLHQQTKGVPASALAFNFSFLTLKNRLLMLNQPLSSARQRGRYLLAAPLALLLALGYAGARAQTAPVAGLPATAQYYIDGQASTKSVVEQLDPATIENMQILTGLQAQSFTHDKAAGNIIVMTTKGHGQSAAVQALNNQLTKAALAVAKPTTVAALPSAALTYITSNDPGYRPLGVGDIGAAGQQPHQYVATIALSRRPTYLLFDENGQRATP